MYQNKKILAVIPARGGSKGIPKKNIKPLLGKPLIHYIIDTLKQSKYIDDIVLTTDSDEIKYVCKNKGIKIHNRDKSLSGDEVPLDPVIYDVAKKYSDYDYIITFQPTSPLISVNTINEAIKKFVDENTNSLISLKEETHLYWKENNGKIVPDFEKRVNRQLLPKKYVETGAIIGTKVKFFLDSKTRLDPSNISFIITSGKESVDIDTYQDWITVEALLKQKNIAINVIGSEKTGLGHIYRQLHIALNLNTKPIFFAKKGNDLAEKIIKENFYEIILYETEKDLYEKLKERKIDLIINDILDTSADYIKNLKKIGLKVINFEDLGEGKYLADYTINELYEFTEDKENILHGYKYVILREDIVYHKKKKISKDVKVVTISCGGTDPNSLTLLYLKSLEKILFDGKINIILGPGYSHMHELSSYLQNSSLKNVEILKNIKNMAEVIYKSDLMLTSNGRTVYEVVCIGTPLIAISQNEQEMQHTFSSLCGCVKYLGLVNFVDFDKLSKEIEKIIKDFDLRKRMNKKMLSYNLGEGTNNFLKVLNLLSDEN